MADFGASQTRNGSLPNGGWDGSCDTWQKFYFPLVTILSISSASAPRKMALAPSCLTTMYPGQEVDLNANPNYWVTHAPVGRRSNRRSEAAESDHQIRRRLRYPPGDVSRPAMRILSCPARAPTGRSWTPWLALPATARKATASRRRQTPPTSPV